MYNNDICFHALLFIALKFAYSICSDSKSDIRNPLSLLAHERRQLGCLSVGAFQSPTDTTIPHLMLHAFEVGDCLSAFKFIQKDSCMPYLWYIHESHFLRFARPYGRAC